MQLVSFFSTFDLECCYNTMLFNCSTLQQRFFIIYILCNFFLVQKSNTKECSKLLEKLLRMKQKRNLIF